MRKKKKPGDLVVVTCSPGAKSLLFPASAQTNDGLPDDLYLFLSYYSTEECQSTLCYGDELLELSSSFYKISLFAIHAMVVLLLSQRACL